METPTYATLADYIADVNLMAPAIRVEFAEVKKSPSGFGEYVRSEIGAETWEDLRDWAAQFADDCPPELCKASAADGLTRNQNGYIFESPAGGIVDIRLVPIDRVIA